MLKWPSVPLPDAAWLAPKAFYPVGMDVALGKQRFAVVDFKMLVRAHVDQTIVAAPAINVDYACNFGFTYDESLPYGLEDFGKHFRLNTTTALEYAKHRSLAARSQPRKPRTPRRRKYDLFAPSSPPSGETCSQCTADLR